MLPASIPSHSGVCQPLQSSFPQLPLSPWKEMDSSSTHARALAWATAGQHAGLCRGVPPAAPADVVTKAVHRAPLLQTAASP